MLGGVGNKKRGEEKTKVTKRVGRKTGRWTQICPIGLDRWTGMCAQSQKRSRVSFIIGFGRRMKKLQDLDPQFHVLHSRAWRCAHYLKELGKIKMGVEGKQKKKSNVLEWRLSSVAD